MNRRSVLLLYILMLLLLLPAIVSSSMSDAVKLSFSGTVTSKPTSIVYLGAWLRGSMPSIYNEWINQTGKGLSMYANMAVFGYPNTPVPNTGAPYISITQRLQESVPWLQQGLFDSVVMTWQTAYSGEDTGTGATECTQRVASGEYDNLIRANAQWIKANFPYRLIIRLNHEFNLYRFGWSANSTVYKNAWHRIVDIFKSEGVNAEWFWCANWNNNPSSLNYLDYYPGDSYVDWVGIDLYAANWALSAEVQLGWQNDAIYNFAVSHGKPLMIGEWGVSMTSDLTDSQNANWLSTLFDGIEARPQIKAMVHWADGDWSIISKDEVGNYKYPQTIQVYKNRVTN